MSYKQQIKNNELITKLRIIKLVKSTKLTQVQVARLFHCHRNTVGKIIRQFDHSFDQETQKQLITKNNWKLDKLQKILMPLKNSSSRPIRHPSQASECQEAAIALWLFEQEELKVGPYSMKTHLNRRFQDSTDPFLKSLTTLSQRQIKGIYKRYLLKTKKARAYSGAKVHVHDYKKLALFQEAHFDTKHILDQKALPRKIYEQFSSYDWMPRYQWTLQFAKSRFRFLAYSRDINSEFGFKYLIFCLMYIRFLFNNWQIKINVGMDNGIEYCRGSKIKLNNWNRVLELVNASAYAYNPNFDIRKNLVERSHKTDDSNFYVARADYLKNKTSFLQEAAGYYHFFNFLRPHRGINMNGKTPFEMIKQGNFIKPKRLMEFPTMILEDHIYTLRQVTEILLFNQELQKIKEERKKEISPKTVIDVAQKYDFFEPVNAQKVLTPYLCAVIKKTQLKTHDIFADFF